MFGFVSSEGEIEKGARPINPLTGRKEIRMKKIADIAPVVVVEAVVVVGNAKEKKIFCRN